MVDPIANEQWKTQVPLQALKQAEEAERLHQEFMASLEGIKPAEKPVVPEVKTDPVIVPVVKEPVVPAVVPGPETAEAILIDELTKARAKAEQQYKVLQGKYNAEVPEYALKVTELTNMIRRLEDLLAAKKVETKTVTFSPEEEQSIGYFKDTLPDVFTAVNLIVDQRSKESAAEIKRLESEIEANKKISVGTDREKFYEGLSGKVENWETINLSPEWIDWLKQPEPYSGFTRQELINDAYGKMDSKRTARFFMDYIKESETVQGVKPDVKEVVKEVKPKKEDIVPATTVTKKPDADINTVAKSEIINSSEVTQYYRELEKHTRMGQKIPDELAVRGVQIDKAIMEGRVQ